MLRAKRRPAFNPVIYSSSAAASLNPLYRYPSDKWVKKRFAGKIIFGTVFFSASVAKADEEEGQTCAKKLEI
jgi:hypothetical protein